MKYRRKKVPIMYFPGLEQKMVELPIYMVDSRKRGQFWFFQFIGYNFCNSCSTLMFLVPNYAG